MPSIRDPNTLGAWFPCSWTGYATARTLIQNPCEASELLAMLFGARILPFDEQAAMMYAGRVSRARAAGRAISTADGQIAAIAAVHGFSVAARDSAPFVAAGVPVVKPWEAGSQGAKP
jgi:predicted nucleic acid-binding protein